MKPVLFINFDGTLCHDKFWRSLPPETLSKIKLFETGPTLGTLLVEVLDGEKLKVEKFPGKTAAQVTGFTEAAQTYYR